MADLKRTLVDGEFILGKHQIKFSDDAAIYFSEGEKKFWFMIDNEIVATLDSQGVCKTREFIELMDTDMRTTPVYAKLYDTTGDGNGDTLVLNNTFDFTYEGTLIDDFNNEDNRYVEKESVPSWLKDYKYGDYKDYIKQVIVLDEIRPRNCRNWFFLLPSVESIDLSKLNTKYVTSMESMFAFCEELTSLDVSRFDTSNVMEMNAMFADCYSLSSLDLSNFNTSNVTDMHSMFDECSSLKYLNLSSFNTQSVKYMDFMFVGCSSLTSLDVSNFDTSNVTSMEETFAGCSNLQELDISSFDTSNLNVAFGIFMDNSNLKTIYASKCFVTDSIVDGNSMFSGCSLLVGGNGTTYNNTKTGKEYARIDNPPSEPRIFYITQKIKERRNKNGSFKNNESKWRFASQ